MKKYTIDYSYKNKYGDGVVEGTVYRKTREEAESFIKELTATEEVTSLVLMASVDVIDKGKWVY